MLAMAPALADVTLPEGTTEIDAQAFLNNTALMGVLTIPDGVTTIGAEAFMNCSGLTAVQFPTDKPVAIGSKAFANCAKLKGSTIVLCEGSNVAADAFAGCGVTIVYPVVPDEEYFTYTTSSEGEVTITGFDESCGIENVIIPDTLGGNKVTKIGSCAFYQCEDVISIIIPDGVTTIEGSAFGECELLTSINIPDSITTIGSDVFLRV